MPTTPDPRAQLRIWIARERRQYADAKWEGELYERKAAAVRDDPHISDDNWWMDFLPNYLGRARTLGLDNPAGRQALAKYIVTCSSMLEHAIDQFGDLPEPGHSSGEVRIWDPIV